MADKGVDFRHCWTKQPEVLKANLIDAVAPSTSIRLISRLKQSTLSLRVQSTFLSLLWHVKLFSTIDVISTIDARPTKKTACLALHASEVAHRTQTPANVAVYHQRHRRRSEVSWNLLFGKMKRWKGWKTTNRISKCDYPNFRVAFSIPSNRINIFV